MKDLSLIAKLLILIGAIAAISTAVMIVICKMKKRRVCDCKTDTVDDRAARDFEECCNACYSDSDDI